MQKPELYDFGLDEKSIAENKKQHERSQQLLEEYFLKRKSIRKIILIISIVLVCIVIVVCCVIGFNNIVSGILLGLSLAWMATYGVIYFQYSDESNWNIRYDKKKEIEESIVDKKLEQAIENYHRALEKYEESLKVNEYSIIQVEVLLPEFNMEAIFPEHGSNKTRTSLGKEWICFSNTYLANPQYYPNLDNIYPNLDNINYDDFKNHYNSIVEMQKQFPPEPKNNLPIPRGDKLVFYYTCSDAYYALKEKKVGDIVELSDGFYSYKILQVFNK